MAWGMPYKGSKNAIAQKIVDALPAGEVFVDLFAGGGAMTHCAMASGKWKRFVMNDKRKGLTAFFKACAEGRGVKNADRWVGREDFFKAAEDDWQTRLCYSFGNDAKTYLYGKDLEAYKCGYHEAVFHKDLSLWHGMGIDAPALEEVEGTRERQLAYRKWIAEKISKGERMLGLQSLESLERLQSLESLERDYREVEIPEGAVVYCDIPYFGTEQYEESGRRAGFDYPAFYEWAKGRGVYVSSYAMPEGFRCVAEFERYSHMSAKGNDKPVTERLFVSE